MTQPAEPAAMANHDQRPRLLPANIRPTAGPSKTFANHDTEDSDLSTPPDSPSSVDSVVARWHDVSNPKVASLEPEPAGPNSDLAGPAKSGLQGNRTNSSPLSDTSSLLYQESSPLCAKSSPLSEESPPTLERSRLREKSALPSTPTRRIMQPYLISPDVLGSPTGREPPEPPARANSPTADIASDPKVEDKSLRKTSFFEGIQYERRGPDGHQVLHLLPTPEQWADFPRILSCARSLGASGDGCFKVVLPSRMYGELPQKRDEKVMGKAYRIKQIKRNSFWHVTTTPAEGLFSPEDSDGHKQGVHEAIANLKKLFLKNNGRRLRQVLYRVDVPAWTPAQRRRAGVPLQSPIHPLKGDGLDKTKAIIPGIHTPYVYESGPHFGATFQIHAEDYRLVSLNHLYKGRKIWMVVPSTAVDVAENALGRKQRCSQFMRHRAEFFFPEKLDKLGIPYRIIDQMPGETVVVLPDAYHQGFSTGYTLAEAKNYADSSWSIETYQACDDKCMLLTAIPAMYMTPLKDGEERVDLCADNGYDEKKQALPDEKTGLATMQEIVNQGLMEEHVAKRVKVF